MRDWRFRLWGLMIAGGGMLLAFSGTVLASIVFTKHNLSASATSNVYYASQEDRVCLICHTPHNADPAGPLWNHTLSSGVTYQPYTSSTLIAAPGQPSGTSKLCLSCHDGTVALGSVYNQSWDLGGGEAVISGLGDPMTGAAVLGTDLRDDHPISFVYNSTLATDNGELESPSALNGAVRLDEGGRLQCTSCHDPHITNPMFLLASRVDGSGYGSPLCTTCHKKTDWELSKHRNSQAVWNGAGTNPWHIAGHNSANDIANSTPKANGCESCHKSHAGGGGERLLKADGEQTLCLDCHNGNVSDPTDPTLNLDLVFSTRLYTHPTLTTDGKHKPERFGFDYKVREDPSNLRLNRHAECIDCHDPHTVLAGVSPDPEDDPVGDTTTRDASNVLNGIWGVEPSWPGSWLDVVSYTEVDDIQYQYQLCLKCHSYYAFQTNPPFDPYSQFIWGAGLVPGWNGQLTDQALEFNPSNESYHPVVTTGKNSFTHSAGGFTDYSSALTNGLTPTSTIGCSDCHTDSFNIASGPKGPHGSDEWPILSGSWGNDAGAYNGANFPSDGDGVLCFRCHDVDSYVYTSATSKDTAKTSTGFYGDGLNLHRYHSQMGRTAANVSGSDIRSGLPCNTCHAAVPHGYQRRAMLVYKDDLPPYNAGRRRRVLWIDSSISHLSGDISGHNHAGTDCGVLDYGIDNISGSPPPLEDPLNTGDWNCSDCHSGWKSC